MTTTMQKAIAAVRSLKPEEVTEKIENGEICAICNEPLDEDYSRPIACSNCGGDAVLEKDAVND